MFIAGILFGAIGAFVVPKPETCVRLDACCQAVAAQPHHNAAIDAAYCRTASTLRIADQCEQVLDVLRTVSQANGVPAVCR